MALPAVLRLLLLVPAMGMLVQVWAGGPVTWAFTAAAMGTDTVQVRLTATCEPGWHIYALVLPSDQGPLPTEVLLDEAPAYSALGAPMEPAPVESDDPNFGVKVRYHGAEVTFSQYVSRNTKLAFVIAGNVQYMACNDMTCLPPRNVPFTVNVPSTDQ